MGVLVVPVGDDDLGVEHGVEAVDVQALVALAGVERLDVPVVPRRSRRDERQADPVFRPGGDRVADELRTVVAAQHQWIPAGDRDLVDQGDGTLTGDEIPLVEALGRVALAVLYITACLAGLAAIGLFVSTLTEQPIAAMITVTIISTAMWILDGISQLDWIHPWLPVHYWPSFADLFRNPMFFDSMRQGLLVTLAYIAVFATLAWARFAQKDITS